MLDELMMQTNITLKSNKESTAPTVALKSNTNKKINLDEFLQPIQKQENKERSRKARQRKKKYYDDLEIRNAQLEKELAKLTKEIDYYKQKLKVYECKCL